MFELGFLGVGLGPLDCSETSILLAAIAFVTGVDKMDGLVTEGDEMVGLVTEGDEVAGFGDGNGATLTCTGSALELGFSSLETDSCVAELAFGVRLFGPLALPFVTWVNSVEVELCVVSG